MSISSPTVRRSFGYLPMLDGIRGLAIALVLAHNTQMLDSPTGTWGKIVEFVLDRGWVGVPLFFVLSGYLISGILLDTQRSANYFRSFFGRRVLRIFPLYFMTLFVMLIVLPSLGLLGARGIPPLHDQLPLWLYYSNWTNWTGAFGWSADELPHYWTLAVEEQFYLIWPFVLLRASARQVLTICGWVAVAALLIRVVMLMSGADSAAVYEFSFCRMDSLALGAAVAAAVRIPKIGNMLCLRQNALYLAIVVLAIAGVLVTRGFGRTSMATQTVGYTIVSLIGALVVLAAVNAGSSHGARALSLLRTAPLRILGKYSYGIYVFHKPLHDFVGKQLIEALNLRLADSASLNLIYVSGCLLASLGLAMLSYHLVEVRFLRLKRYFEASP